MGVEVVAPEKVQAPIDSVREVDETIMHEKENLKLDEVSGLAEPIQFGSHGEEPVRAEGNDVTDAKLPKDAIDEWPAPKQIHSFYFVTYRQYDDPKIKSKIDQADKEIQKRNLSRFEITEKLKAKRAKRAELVNQVRTLKNEGRQYKSMFDEKKKKMEPLQHALGKLRDTNSAGRGGLCSSEEELNDLIYSLQYRIQHESIPLTEEKQILREIKQFEGTREKVIANAAMRAKIQDSMGQKEAIQDQVKLIGVDLDGVRKEQQVLWGKHERREERDDVDDKVNGVEKSSKHTRKKSGRGEERERERDRDHKSKDRERSKKTSDNDVGKDKSRDSKVKDKEHDREKSREKDKDRKDRGKEKERERDREKKERERERVKEKEKHKDREKDRDNDKERERGREKTKERERDREADQDKERSREKDRASRKSNEEDYDGKFQMDYEDEVDKDTRKQGKVSFRDEDEQSAEGASAGAHTSASELEQRILKMKEERTKKKPESVSDVLAWVGRSRKIEENKYAAKERAKHLSKIFEEQDNIGQGDSDDEEADQHNAHNLAGIKVLDGLDKVLEGGAVVLTLKDQNILADGDINEEVDMLENVEIGEQKRRDGAYKAAKKKTGIYDDKFNDDPASEKKMLPQYDDANADEGVTLDERGRFTGEAEKKLEELRKRLQGTSTSARLEDLNSSGKISSDYFTHEEMLQFKKPKKKKSLRKKDKLDIDALEAEAVSAGLGIGDLGSRKDGRRQAIREERERSEAEMRNNAYQSAYAKADEASKSLRLEQTLQTKVEEEENLVFADDEEDLYKSLERARKLALKKQEAEASGPLAIAHLASTTLSSQIADDKNPETGESHENKLVFTEMEEFVSAIQLAEEVHKPDNEDVFMDEDEPPRVSDEEQKDEAGGWMEVPDNSKDENPVNEDEEIVPDETIHEVAVGKGLSGALKLLKERGTLKESIDWGGRNMDKKKSKLVGIVDDDVGTNNDNKFKDIRIERTDEFGRIMTPKEAFRMISHKFHGKGPGKMKQEKRMKQYQEELKLKQMKNSDTPSLSVERMRGAQAQLKTPYLVLSGHVKPGQTSDPRSGFATVEKDLPGGLTPMLGDKKVEHFLGIKRKPETGFSGAPKKPKI